MNQEVDILTKLFEPDTLTDQQEQEKERVLYFTKSAESLRVNDNQELDILATLFESNTQEQMQQPYEPQEQPMQQTQTLHQSQLQKQQEPQEQLIGTHNPFLTLSSMSSSTSETTCDLLNISPANQGNNQTDVNSILSIIMPPDPEPVPRGRKEEEEEEQIHQIVLNQLASMSIVPEHLAHMPSQKTDHVVSEGFRRYFSQEFNNPADWLHSKSNEKYGAGIQYTLNYDQFLRRGTIEDRAKEQETEEMQYLARIRQLCQEQWAKWDDSNMNETTLLYEKRRIIGRNDYN
jgi:hypothetical protein